MTKKLIRYFFTAGVAAIIDLLGFSLLFRLGLSVLFSAIASWFLAAIANYILTSRFVFHKNVDLIQFFRFILGASIGFGLNVAITVILTQYGQIYPPLAKMLAIGCAFLFNFAINLLWVFRPKST